MPPRRWRSISVCGYNETAPVEALAQQITVTVVGGKANGGARSFDGGQTIVSQDEMYSFSATENVTLTAVYSDIAPGGKQPEGEQPEETEKSGCGSTVTYEAWLLSVVFFGFGGFASP